MNYHELRISSRRLSRKDNSTLQPALRVSDVGETGFINWSRQELPLHCLRLDVNHLQANWQDQLQFVQARKPESENKTWL